MIKVRYDRENYHNITEGDIVSIGDAYYIVEERIKGGMGMVLLLKQDIKKTKPKPRILGLKIALKSSLQFSERSDLHDIFKREVTVWAGLKHPHILQLLEILDVGNEEWVASMNWCEGTLRSLIQDGQQLNNQEITVIMLSMISALDYAYRDKKILHLDLKPENILYETDIFDEKSRNHYMVSDWGISAIKNNDLNLIIQNKFGDQILKKSYNNMGTFKYMAPERFLPGTQATITSDIFSLGMIYFELNAGKLPFNEEMLPIHALRSREYYKEAKKILFSLNVSSEIKNLILSMIAPSAENRPNSYSVLYSKIKNTTVKKPFWSSLFK